MWKGAGFKQNSHIFKKNIMLFVMFFMQNSKIYAIINMRSCIYDRKRRLQKAMEATY